MAAAAAITQPRSRGRRENAAASISGPANSMVTATPSGMRAIAAKKKPFMPANATANSAADLHCCRSQPNARGRWIAISKVAANNSRTPVVSPAPKCASSGVAIAAPSCSEMHDPRIMRTGNGVRDAMH